LAKEITRGTLLSNVARTDLHKLSDSLGFARRIADGSTMASEPSIKYYKGKLHRRKAYFLVYNRVAYVFA
jgi:hypothetical protein